jgi:cell division transport system permease protein
MSRLVYFVRETLISLRRNLLMTLAGILTVAVSLFLFGGIALLQRLVDHGTAQWKNGVAFEVFMDVEASQQQIGDVRSELDDLKRAGDLKSYRFLSKDDAYREFRKIFRDQPALIENTRAEDLPTSFRVAPTQAEQSERLAQRFESVSGVQSVLTAQEQVDRLLTASRWIRYAFFAMAIALLASSLFLIVNTIRLATFARRREIEVMKLVGASNWFVRVPFMAEGLVQGAIGAGIAVGLIYTLKVVLTDLLRSANEGLWRGWYLTNGDALVIGFVVLLIGAVIGMVGSAIGLRRFLDV